MSKGEPAGNAGVCWTSAGTRRAAALLAAFARGLFLVTFTAWRLSAQTAISADGVVESTSGGFRFPDGSLQMTAAGPFGAPVETTDQRGCWDAAGTLIACAGTGQDAALNKGVAWPVPRFTDNANGTVTDNLTGLIWLKLADCFGGRTWTQALSDASGLAAGFCGLTDGSVAGDWRLANVKELLSLVSYKQTNPALPFGHPFTTYVTLVYWSSTTHIGYLDEAWYVEFVAGSTFGLAKGVTAGVWPVRGGH